MRRSNRLHSKKPIEGRYPTCARRLAASPRATSGDGPRITAVQYIRLNPDLSGYLFLKEQTTAGEMLFRIRQIIRNGSAEHPRGRRAEILQRPESGV